ncbi:hypothetical protein [Rhizobacter sp. Root1221]|uniref:hypothetical protein n=1 Tax=Rhizobacter sp. Root1221 TaxID=1736433 RepID=UPI0006F3EEFD|nr:hypothetical protein [Rhizobacter sp. Root1221]KQW00374.1 hypothetical protein ASC87_17605 [Rhizobacter sp. Root1221]
MKNPFRFWMTGGAAMILAALSGGTRAMGTDDRPVHSRVSRYSVQDTVTRIEASALRHGLTIMARLQQAAPHGRAERETFEPRLIIVLESSQGGTPVSMDGPNEMPALLLSVTVHQGEGGTTEVWFSDGTFDELPDGMTPEVRHDLADLPSLVDEALAFESDTEVPEVTRQLVLQA